MVKLNLDRYAWRAQVWPVYLTIIPAILVIATILPEGMKWPFAGLPAIVFLPLSYFMSQICSDLGKRLEPTLWNSWGGPPTTRFLRHCNEEFNPVMRARIHAQLQALKLPIPTAEEEKEYPERAVDLYNAAIDEIRRLTRNTERFPLVYKGNIEYGFRRNLLGLKPYGIVITILALVVSGWLLLRGWHVNGVVLPVALVATFLNTCIALGWLIGVCSANVRITADRYAQYLLEAILNLDIPHEHREIPSRG